MKFYPYILTALVILSGCITTTDAINGYQTMILGDWDCSTDSDAVTGKTEYRSDGSFTGYDRAQIPGLENTYLELKVEGEWYFESGSEIVDQIKVDQIKDIQVLKVVSDFPGFSADKKEQLRKFYQKGLTEEISRDSLSRAKTVFQDANTFHLINHEDDKTTICTRLQQNGQ